MRSHAERGNEQILEGITHDRSQFAASPDTPPFLPRLRLGLGSVALATLLNEGQAPAADSVPLVNPLAPKKGHFPAKAKNVIFLFMAGGPSQLELFDHKPKLDQLHGKPIPDEFIKGKRFAFMDTFTKEVPKLLGTRRKFARHGQSRDLGVGMSAAHRGHRRRHRHRALAGDRRLQSRAGQAVHEHRLAAVRPAEHRAPG